jgi:hypothetical protein
MALMRVSIFDVDERMKPIASGISTSTAAMASRANASSLAGTLST